MISRTSFVVLLASLLLCGTAVPVDAATYYVKNGGSNAANGLSPATAWATLNYAADRVMPGDTVRVQNGSYQGFYLDRSGSPGSPITFLADGAEVQITSDNGTTPDGINVEGAAHVVIDGFQVHNRTRSGIRVALSEFVTIRNCNTGHNGRWGIFTGFADDLTIEHNQTHHSVLEHGIYVSNSGDRPVIRNNHSYDNYANGIHMNGDESQGGDGVISNALVENNIIHGNGTGGGSGINMDGVSNSIVRNNLLYDNHASGISLYRIDGATGSRNNLVINNTIINASNARWCINISGGSTGNTLRNNILYNLHSFRGVITIDSASRSGFTSDYNSLMNRFSTDGGNSVSTLATWQAQGYDTHSLLATPSQHFVTPGSDFHLDPDSPAIDAGSATNAPAQDIEGSPRPAGSGVDLGAYERQLLTCGDGDADAGEQCGEPGLECNDPCSSCAGCACIANPLVCGDALLCGAEECESDNDCSAGQTCHDCACVNPPLCTSGAVIRKPSLRLEADSSDLRFKGQAVVPKPWSGIDPIANGLRLRIDSANSSEELDITIPGGLLADRVGWKVNSRGTTWTYRDDKRVQGPISRLVLRDLSRREDGLLGWSVRGSGGAITLPPASSVRSTLVFGAPGECAQLQWNPPGEPRPYCSGNAATLICR
ncbi:MAG TPA: right-handed parallel beta-helix repeat-containing protein [Terriglobales bacterium]|nr:right-handed parallel beta-helix repeat-containing protein [Terriglobales bacterium]